MFVYLMDHLVRFPNYPRGSRLHLSREELEETVNGRNILRAIFLGLLLLSPVDVARSQTGPEILGVRGAGENAPPGTAQPAQPQSFWQRLVAHIRRIFGGAPEVVQPTQTTLPVREPQIPGTTPGATPRATPTPGPTAVPDPAAPTRPGNDLPPPEDAATPPGPGENLPGDTFPWAGPIDISSAKCRLHLVNAHFTNGMTHSSLLLTLHTIECRELRCGLL